MNRILKLMVCAIVVLSVTDLLLAGTIDPGLGDILANTPADQPVSVLVFLEDRVDLFQVTSQLDQQSATRQHRHETVVRALQDKARVTQGQILVCLGQHQRAGDVTNFRAHWIANCVRVDALPATIEDIAARPDVETVYYNYEIESIKPEEADPPAGQRGGGPRTPEPGVQAVRAPEVWAMGFTGEGILVSTLDTGVDGSHPALASRWRGVADPRYAGHPEWAFFDPYTSWTFPQDSASHGTHTMGTVCGGAPGDEVGVAPGAQWIHAAVIDREGMQQTIDDAILAFQWLIDPDGDPATSWDVPQVNSNSWGIATGHFIPPYSNPCDESFWAFLDACEAAGIVILFSAGNEGYYGPDSLRRPADRATDDYRTCAVGGIDANNPPNWTIYDASSRGPTYCTPGGEAAVKPDINAPAVDVVSSMPGTGYGSKTGTSMASPHVNGVVALILEACPALPVDEVKQIMYDTALDLGAPGKDNNYGYGLVDAYDAVQLALTICLAPPQANDVYFETPVDTAALVTLDATDYNGLPDPLTYTVTSLPLPGNTIADAGNGYLITAGDLPYTLINNGNQLTYTPTGGYYGTDTFDYKASDGGVPPDGGDSNIATVSVLVFFGPPVITTTSLPTGTLNGLYGPVTLEADGGQPELAWDLLIVQYYERDIGSSLFTSGGVAQGWHADDGTWSYTLPFTFTYYEVDYTSVWVCSNGFIDFASPSNAWINSDSELISNIRIAPLWDDLRTDVGGYDIYIDESVHGQVTIRWDARTFIGGGYPCNFSVTLYDDGLIEFHYGSGNIGLSPTIGISAGDGDNYILSMYNNASSLTNANSLEFGMLPILPEGLVLSTDGVITGTPTETGTFNPTFRVTDSWNRTDQRTISIIINEESLPPIAEDVDTATAASTPADIILTADDPNGDPLTYTIESLPPAGQGTLFDPDAGQIDSVPYDLAAGGNVVRYHPPFAQNLQTSFTFSARDAILGSNVAAVSVTVGIIVPEEIHSFPLVSDPGWITQGQWAYGQPTGGGSQGGDPTSGYTGANVYGYNLSGDYTNEMPVYSLTTTAIDCSLRRGVELRFWRWLGVESSSSDHAAIQVSADGSDWTPVWEHTGSSVADDSWSQMSVDISSVADGASMVFVRWDMGTTDGDVTYPGWNIDDVEIWALAPVVDPCVGVSFTVGDVNEDTLINGADVDLFIDILMDPAGPWVGGQWCAADTDTNDKITIADVDDLVALLLAA